jgi:hypothetical protein
LSQLGRFWLLYGIMMTTEAISPVEVKLSKGQAKKSYSLVGE